MNGALKRDVVAGALAGLVAGTISGWAILAQGLTATAASFIGVAPSGGGFAVHLAVSAFIGGSFGAVFRYSPYGSAASLTGGILYGLLWWIIGSLTLIPLVQGRPPAWSIDAAGDALPNLVAQLLYGAITGGLFSVLVSQYLRRTPAPAAVPHDREPLTRVVILGGGFGGISAAQRLDQIYARDRSVETTLISHSNYLLFTPMLAEVAASGLEAQHISAPVRAALARVRFLKADVETIDPAAQVVRLRASAGSAAETVPYDHLILALGSVPNFYGLPGLEAHSFTLKTLADATALRNHVIGMLEAADGEPDPAQRRAQLTFVVAGGGFAGTEMVAELSDLVRGILRYYPNIGRDEPRFILVHSGERILPEISPQLADYALSKLTARGIEFLLKTRVAGATAETVSFTDGGGIPTRTLVWTAGNQPHPLLGPLPCEKNRVGAVIDAPSLQVKGLANVWAVGDCAEIPDAYTDRPCPPTAQHALRQGTAVADNVSVVLRGAAPVPFKFRTVGVLVALGRRTAVAEIRGWKFSGFLAWFIWRTVYLARLPGFEKKLRVALDWTLDLFFPRDIVLMAPSAAPTLSQTIGAPVPAPTPSPVGEPVGDQP